MPCFILFYSMALWPFVSYFLRFPFLLRFSSFEPLKFVFAFVYHRWTWTCFWTVFVFALVFGSGFGFGFGLGVNWTEKLTRTTHVECDVICVAISLLLVPLEATRRLRLRRYLRCLRLSHHSPGGHIHNNKKNTDNESMRTT